MYRRPIKFGIGDCLKCLKKFLKANSRQKYCSKKCAKYAPSVKEILADVDCSRCNKPFQPKNRFQKYCSPECSKPVATVEDDVEKKIPAGTVGAIHELQVSVDLMRKGWGVFRAVSPSCPCDLVAIKNGISLLIQVTKARKSNFGTAMFSPHRGEWFDVLALSFASGEVEYRPPLPE